MSYCDSYSLLEMSNGGLLKLCMYQGRALLTVVR